MLGPVRTRLPPRARRSMPPLRLSPTLRTAVWLVWLPVAGAATAKNFRWEIDYFRTHQPSFYVALLAALPLLLAACAIYVRLRSAWLWRWEIPSLVSACVLAALFYQPLPTLIAGLVFVASLGAGLKLARLIRIPLDTSLETVTMGFALGSAVLLTVLFALGMLHAYYPAVFLLLLAVPCALFWRDAKHGILSVWRAVSIAGRSDSLKHPLASIAFFFLVPAAFCTLGVALSPSIAFDPLATHLASARVYAAQHVLRPLASLDYSYYPQGGESLMALGYSLGGQPAAQMISPLFWILFLLLLVVVARACGMDRPAAMAGVAVVALLPFLHWTGSNSKNDLPMVFFQAAALFAFIRSATTRAAGWILAGALFLGSAFSIKHVALFGAIPLLAFFLYALMRSASRVRSAWAFCLVLAVSGLYWHVRTFVLTGNPVFPERLTQGVHTVGKRHVDPRFGQIARLWMVPWRAHFDGQHSFQSPLPDPVGIAFLVFLPLSIVVPRPSGSAWISARRACLLFSFAYLGYWAMIIGDVRYAILPIGLLVLLLVGKAPSFYNGQHHPALRLSVATALAGVLLFGLLGIAIIEVNAPELSLFARRIDFSAYLHRALETYGSLDWLNQNHVDSKVFAIGNCSRAYAPDPARFYCAFHIPGKTERSAYLILPEGYAGPPGARLTYRDTFFSVYYVGASEPQP